MICLIDQRNADDSLGLLSFSVKPDPSWNLFKVTPDELIVFGTGSEEGTARPRSRRLISLLRGLYCLEARLAFVTEGAGGERTGSRFAAIRARWTSRSDGTSAPGMRVAELGVIESRAGMRYRRERMAIMVVCIRRCSCR
jgi:hypothetical protein